MKFCQLSINYRLNSFFFWFIKLLIKFKTYEQKLRLNKFKNIISINYL